MGKIQTKKHNLTPSAHTRATTHHRLRHHPRMHTCQTQSSRKTVLEPRKSTHTRLQTKKRMAPKKRKHTTTINTYYTNI